MKKTTIGNIKRFIQESLQSEKSALDLRPGDVFDDGDGEWHTVSFTHFYPPNVVQVKCDDGFEIDLHSRETVAVR